MKFTFLFFSLILMSLITFNSSFVIHHSPFTIKYSLSIIPHQLRGIEAAPLTWREYKSFDGKFRVIVPDGEMTEKVSKIKTAVGELPYHTFLNRPNEKSPDNIFYLVNYCDYPKDTFHPDSTELINEFMTTTIESSAKSVGGSVTYSGDIEQLSRKGKVWRVQYNNDRALIKSKCFLVGDRFYMIQTMMLREKAMNPSADKFLDSFQFF